MQKFTEKSMDFQVKIIERSGLGDETYLPQGGTLSQHYLQQTLFSFLLELWFRVYSDFQTAIYKSAVLSVQCSCSRSTSQYFLEGSSRGGGDGHV